MGKVKNSEDLRIRLQQASGEDILASGWGTLGMKNVFVGVTPSALFLEFISFTMKSKEVKRILFEDLEFVYAVAGDASTPKLMKMNIEARITDSITGTLLFKENMGKLTHILFRKMPRHDDNSRAPFRITEFLASAKPELVHLPDISAKREPQSKGGCLRRFALITLVLTAIFTILFGLLLEGGWGKASMVGFSTALVFGGISAPLVPVFKRMITGRG
ncbi:MAG: hypothetical protein KAR40_01705 [Candidatus Sabulitectum sp.]|nr:hypothetical protein [Candidatus Sabulitectum sp.]